MKAIILGSSRGIRHLDSSKSYPIALLTDKLGRRVLDWQLAALDAAGIDDVVFVGGYHIEKVIAAYPNLRFYYMPDWSDAGQPAVLSQVANELNEPVVLLSSDVVFREELLSTLMSGPQSVRGVVTSHGAVKLAHLDAEAAGQLQRAIAHTNDVPLSQTLAGLTASAELWQEDEQLAIVEGAGSLARFAFGTKAQTLERLRPLLQAATILEQLRFAVHEWEQRSNDVLAQIAKAFSGSVVIRSSALAEDSWTESQAGRFESVIGVSPADADALRDAIDVVVSSYSQNEVRDGNNEFFIQPELTNVDCSGVAFSRQPENAAPYLVVNYDDQTALTDTVTSGRGTSLRTVIACRQDAHVHQHSVVSRLLPAIVELEELLGHGALDIEFAVADDELYILQVRVLVVTSDNAVVDADFHDELTGICQRIDELLAPRVGLLGERTILANMPDWNPAEIIGVSPRPLALSLYQHVITDRIWGQARAASGYRDTAPEPLVLALACHPYVDTRSSFNSLLPATLEEDLAARLVEHYVERLTVSPELHDKIEFEVAITCLDFDFAPKQKRLLAAGFSQSETETIRDSLRQLTNNIVNDVVAPASVQFEAIAQLADKRSACLAAPRDSLFAQARTIDVLLADCMRFGTLPFAVLARYAFMATAFMRSLVRTGALTAAESEAFFAALPSVTTALKHDLAKQASGEMTTDAFLERYGHLRPGTYNILSPTYRDQPDFYFTGAPDKTDTDGSEAAATAILAAKRPAIDAAIAEAGFDFDADRLIAFIVTNIPGRERAKLEFTRSLSAALDELVALGERFELSRDDLSYLPIERFLELVTRSPSSVQASELRRLASLNRKRHELHMAIRLPHMICRSDDVLCFELLPWQPNYVSSKQVSAAVCDVDAADGQPDLEGRIALIESADPGYDWIFSRGIAGLVTKYGGAASHMAIRAAELGLPAAIGCGDLLYEQLRKSERIEMDCGSRRLRGVQ